MGGGGQSSSSWGHLGGGGVGPREVKAKRRKADKEDKAHCRLTRASFLAYLVLAALWFTSSQG